MHLLHLFTKSPKFGVSGALLLIAFVNLAYGKVMINKCCRLGDYLDRTRTCVVGGLEATDKWVPPVYQPKKNGTYKNIGELPSNMQLSEAQIPSTCDEPEFYFTANNIILIGNGSLFLNEKALMIPPSDYCIDKNTALVCIPRLANKMDHLKAPKILSKVKKCCGANAAYSQENGTCIYLQRSHELFSASVIKSPQVDVVSGFPECQHNDFALAGQFNVVNFDEETGEVKMEGEKTFEANHFCIDHVIDGGESSINIFTCSEHVQPASVPVRVDHQDIRFVLYSIGLLISVIFLFATLACGFLVPSNHHVLHWRCQTHYVACLLVGDLLLAITQIAGNSIVGPACSIIGKSSLKYTSLPVPFCGRICDSCLKTNNIYN